VGSAIKGEIFLANITLFVIIKYLALFGGDGRHAEPDASLANVWVSVTAAQTITANATQSVAINIGKKHVSTASQSSTNSAIATTAHFDRSTRVEWFVTSWTLEL